MARERMCLTGDDETLGQAGKERKCKGMSYQADTTNRAASRVAKRGPHNTHLSSANLWSMKTAHSTQHAAHHSPPGFMVGSSK